MVVEQWGQSRTIEKVKMRLYGEINVSKHQKLSFDAAHVLFSIFKMAGLITLVSNDLWQLSPSIHHLGNKRTVPMYTPTTIAFDVYLFYNIYIKK